jgi:hypothetical protein
MIGKSENQVSKTAIRLLHTEGESNFGEILTEAMKEESTPADFTQTAYSGLIITHYYMICFSAYFYAYYV